MAGCKSGEGVKAAGGGIRHTSVVGRIFRQRAPIYPASVDNELVVDDGRLMAPSPAEILDGVLLLQGRLYKEEEQDEGSPAREGGRHWTLRGRHCRNDARLLSALRKPNRVIGSLLSSRR
jgi:hypothetical protein